MASPPPRGLLRFATYELELDSAELRRGGRLVPLQTQPARLLALLAQRSGEVVSREEIRRRLWPDGIVVEFDQSINQSVRQLRQVLGDSAVSPRWIETLPGRGYRFLVPLRPAEAAASVAGPESISASTSTSPSISSSISSWSAAADADTASVSGATDARAASAPVSASTASPSPASTADRRATASLRSATPPRSWPRWTRRSALLLAAAAALGLRVGRSSTPPRPAAGAHMREADGAVRLAVLPPSATDRTEAAFGVAFTEELISALGERYAPRLAVIAPRSVLRYREDPRSATQIAEELGVEYLVQGTVRALPDHRHRLTVSLVRGRDQRQLWARAYDSSGDAAARGAAPTVAELAPDIAAALALRLAPAAVDAPLPPAAEEAYLRGRYALRAGRIYAAMHALAEASAYAPGSAKVWSARAMAAWRRGDAEQMPPAGAPSCQDCGGSAAARRFAEAAFTAALDSGSTAGLAEAHYVRASLALFHDWNLEDAYRHYTAAIAANPAFAEAHHDLSAYYSANGRHDEAIASMRRALALDPMSPEVVSDVGWYYLLARRYREAAAWCERTLTLEPRFFYAHRCAVLAHTASGDLELALGAAVRDLRDRGADPATILAVEAPAAASWLDRARWGWQRQARAHLQAYWRWELSAAAASRGDAGDRAVAWLAAGEPERAMQELERAVATRTAWVLPFLAVDPTFDPLRAWPRFAAVVSAVRDGGRAVDP